MSRMTQLGIFSAVTGGVFLFLGLFPFAVDADIAPGFGILQLFSMLVGLSLLVLGAYIVVYTLVHRGEPRSLRQNIAIRLGMTGLVFSAGAILSDVMGFGSHIVSGEPLFGWLQAAGMLLGFLIAAIGVLLYAISPS